jgi:ELWxxDGT repeat protein
MHSAPGHSRGSAVAFPLLIGILSLLLLTSPTTLWAIGHPFAVKEINPGGNAIDPYTVNPFVTIGDHILFAADDGSKGTELWVSDGSASGTVLLKEINPGAAGAYPQFLTPLNGKVVFRATEPASGTELWVTDGTTDGTQMLADIYPGTSGSAPQKFARVGNILYFVASTATGSKLWKTDGTPAGTVPATEFTPSFYSFIESVTADNGKLLVVTCLSSMTISWELWQIDPAAGTTSRITTVLRQPKNVTPCGGKMFFSLVTEAYGDELWVTDGTESGTTLVKDIHPSGSATPSQLFCLAGTLYFSAGEPATGIELWKSDGTQSGTLLVKDINPGSASSYPWGLKAFNGKLVLQASDGTTGGELWISDGSAEGTVLVKDINSGNGGGATTDDLAVAGNLAIFPAIDGVHGEEVWVTDGTTATTFLLADLQPGNNPSLPGNFTVNGNTLFFSAYDQNTHYTLFAASLAPAPHSLITSPLTGTAVSSPNISLSGEAHSDTGSPVSLVEISLDGGTNYLPAIGTAEWSFTATLPEDGIYAIRARATDGAGTQELPLPAETVKVTLDRTPPQRVHPDQWRGRNDNRHAGDP